jgi:hypothetical protein
MEKIESSKLEQDKKKELVVSTPRLHGNYDRALTAEYGRDSPSK